MKVSGIQGIVELPELRGWDPRTGPTRIRRFKAPRSLAGPAASAGTVENILRAEGTKYQTEDSDPGHVIVNATYSTDEGANPDDAPSSDDWDTEDGFTEKSLWELPSIQALMDLFDVPTRAVIRQIFEACLKGERTFDFPAIGNIPAGSGPIDINVLAALIGNVAGSPAAGALMLQFFGERVKGVEAFRVEIHTVIRTRIAPVSTSLKPTRTNVNKLFTPAGMASTEGFPGEAVAGFALHDGFYLKCHPKCRRLGSSKREIIQTYEWCETFSQLVYPDSPVA